MKADILKLLLQSHADGDESSFRKVVVNRPSKMQQPIPPANAGDGGGAS